MNLTTYKKKRNFKNTSEPKGKIGKKNKSRFVIQHHLARKEHYDFRLEYDGVLVSFAVPKGLSTDPTDKRLAVHVEDHPIDYINFKGTIPKGNYGAGTVDIFDKGTYRPIFDMKTGLKKGHLKFKLNGKKMKGVWNLVRTNEPHWLMIKSNDDIEFSKKTKSKTSKKAKNPFTTCDVKLAKLTDSIPKKDYIFEIKYDGYRIVAYVEKSVKLKSRNNKDYTNKFPNIAKSLEKLSGSMVLDGEVVVFDEDGKSNFQLLTESIKNGKDNFCYVVFDMLALDGKDLRNMPLLDRKTILNDALNNLAAKNIILSSFVENKGKESLGLAKKLGLEGIVAKKNDSQYNGNRDDDWLKIKCYKRQEFVIGGYVKTEKNKNLSAIYVGYYDKGKLIFAGKVGTGFNELLRTELDKKFQKVKRKTCPFENLKDGDATWLTPTLVAEIQFAEITKNGVLRQPSFIGLREDKKAKDVHLEKNNER